MKSKSFIFLFLLIFMIVLSLSAVSAEDLQNESTNSVDDAQILSDSSNEVIPVSDEVSGDVDIATVNPGTTSGQLNYNVPSEAKEIKHADLYVNVYSGSAQNTYGANANVSIVTSSEEKQIASEQLWTVDGSTDGTIYTVNDHINKCYSDYQMYYDITDSVKGLNGSSITIKVDTFKMADKQFDGRIKLIALVLAYDDGDDDQIFYWVNPTQLWTKTNVTSTFNTSAITDVYAASLTNIALSSGDGSFRVNDKSIGDAINHTSGGFYYQYNYWDVTDKIDEGQNTLFTSINIGTSSYGSLKNVLSVLKMERIEADVSLATEYTSVNTCYAGTNNTLTITVNTNKAGKYTVNLLADGAVVDSKEVDLVSGANTLYLTDPTIRPIDETTVNGANNTQVTYEVNVKYENTSLANANKTVPVLYNGNLGYDLEYNVVGFEDFVNVVINGDIVIDIKEVGSYLGAAAMNRTDVWNVALDSNSSIVKSILYVPYNWFNAKTYTEDVNMFNVTFNGASIAPVAWYRDQGNLGNYGKYGYGVFVYDVTNLTGNGDNTLVLNKVNPTPAVYPSALVYMYNTTGSSAVKSVSIVNGADLLANSNNNAGRVAKADTVINVAKNDIAVLYVLAAGAQAGEGNIIVNGNVFTNVWSGTSSTTDLFTADISNIVQDSNAVSFVATGSTILALPQIIVTTGASVDVSLNTEYTSVKSAYAGTNNTLTVTVNTNKAGKYTVNLYADGVVVDSQEVDLASGANTLYLTDPTIRPIDATTVNGANNTKVTYAAEVIYNGVVLADNSITVPVLYNGNLGSDLEYNITGFEDFANIVINGDIVIDIKEVGSYLGAAAMNRTDVWNVALDSNSSIVKSILYVPYNWFNAKTYTEDVNMFNVTFNGASIAPVAWYRDQGNLGNYGKYGYGVFVYDVTGLVGNGDNTLVLNKVNPTPAVYPSALVYMYNTTTSHAVKKVSIINGADLLANSNNNAGRVAKADTVINVAKNDVAVLYVLAAGAQAGEGNIIVNGNVFTNVWSGTSSTTDLFMADISNIVQDSNAVSFVATGSTILALPQIIVTTSNVVADVSLNTEYTSVKSAYAGTNNTLTVTVNTNKTGKYTVNLYADGVVVDSQEVDLASGANTLYLTDPTIRPIDASTVNGANNTKVTYAAEVIYNGDVIADNNITVPVLYNGNLGSDLEYNITGFEDFANIVINGDIVVDIKDVASYLGASAMNRTDVWTISLDNNSDVVKSILYIPYNWFNAKTYTEDMNMFNVTFNGASIAPVAWYRDQGNLGNYGKYGYGVFVYDVTDLTGNGDNTLVLNKVNPTPAVYPSALVYMYNTTGSSAVKSVSIVNGADLLANSNNNAGRIAKADTVISANTNNVIEATLYVLAASAQAGEGNVIVNGNVFTNVWSGTSSTTDLFTVDITGIVNDSNAVSFVATGSTILALPQIIVTSNLVADVALNTEYTSVKSAYAGTNNTLTVTVNTNKEGKYTIVLYADGVAVDSKEVDLVSGATTLHLTDPTIRPIDATTVNGANNTKVTYSAKLVYDEKDVVNSSITVPVLYNGNLGSDLEYNITGFDGNIDVVINGDIVIDIKDVGSYLGASAMNRTDVWTISLGANSNIVKSILYVPYNWFNAKSYTEDVNMFNVTFNGASIAPVAWYRDQGNLGNYGKYGYGVFVYDVTGLVGNGDNTLVLNKVNPTPAVYPSALVYMYNTTTSHAVKTVSILNGADLLANSNNNAGRIAKADTVINVTSSDILKSTLYVLAASAQAGEGNIIVNGNVFANVWNGTSSTTDLFKTDVTGIVKDSNAISFVATGSTILALPQILVSSHVIKTTVTPTKLSTTYDSGKTFNIKVVDGNKKPISGLKLTLKVYTGKTYKTVTVSTNANGIATYKASTLAIGTHKVEITSNNANYNVKKTTSSIVIAKAKTTVKAPKVTSKVKKAKYFKVSVVNKASKRVVKNVKVKLKVYTGKKYKIYNIKTNSKGFAQINVKSLAVGTHKVVITTGDTKYLMSATSSIVIKK